MIPHPPHPSPAGRPPCAPTGEAPPRPPVATGATRTAPGRGATPPPAPEPSEPHLKGAPQRELGSTSAIVYRLYNNAGDLLYVGCTRRLGKRLRSHRADKPWWSDVASMDLTLYLHHDDALAAEADAIRRERPAHNRLGSPWWHPPHPRCQGLTRDGFACRRIVRPYDTHCAAHADQTPDALFDLEPPAPEHHGIH